MSDTFTPDTLSEGEPASGVAGVTESQTPDLAETTAASATAEPESDADDEQGDEQPQQRQSRAERRISHLAARAQNAETQLAEAMQIIRQMASGQQPTQQQPTQRAPQADPLAGYIAQQVGPAPKAEDFPAGEFDPAYRAAELDYVRKAAAVEAQARITQQLQQAQMASREQQLAANLAQQVAVIEKADPEARTAIAELGMRLGKAGQHGQAVANVIAELGADVAYHIARNPEVEARLRSVPVPVALIELGEIRATLKARAATPVVQPTSAPTPPPRLRGGSSNIADIDRMPMSQAAEMIRKEIGDKGWR